MLKFAYYFSTSFIILGKNGAAEKLSKNAKQSDAPRYRKIRKGQEVDSGLLSSVRRKKLRN